MTALRQSTLSSGFTVPMIWVYHSRAMTGLSARAESSLDCSTFGRAAGCTPVPAMSTSWSPLMIWLSRSSACKPSLTSIWSGSALRLGSVEASQLGLRTSVPPVATSTSPFHMYGPEETGCEVYFAPVSLAAGTGAVMGRDARLSNSANGALRWKMMVVSLGVSIAEELSAFFGLLYGPL